jgi:hypothetical protein
MSDSRWLRVELVLECVDDVGDVIDTCRHQFRYVHVEPITEHEAAAVIDAIRDPLAFH